MSRFKRHFVDHPNIVLHLADCTSHKEVDKLESLFQDFPNIVQEFVLENFAKT